MKQTEGDYSVDTTALIAGVQGDDRQTVLHRALNRAWLRRTRFAPDISRLVPFLTDIITTDLQSRLNAILLLLRIVEQEGVDASVVAAVPALGGCLGSDWCEWHVILSALWVLETIGPPAAITIPTIVDCLERWIEDDEDETDIACRAIETLGAIGPAATITLPWLLPALEHPEAWVRDAAALTIFRIGAGRSDAYQRYKPVELRGAGERRIRTLLQHDIAPHTHDLITALRHPQGTVRRAAMWCLTWVARRSNADPTLETAVPLLLDILRHGTVRDKRMANEALGAIEKRARAAIPILHAALVEADAAEEVDLRREILDTLVEVGGVFLPSIDSLAVMRRIIRDTRSEWGAKKKLREERQFNIAAGYLQQIAWQRLHLMDERFQQEVVKTVPSLAQQLTENQNPRIRRRCARMLGQFGHLSRVAQPSLTAALADPVHEVQQAVKLAIRRLQ